MTNTVEQHQQCLENLLLSEDLEELKNLTENFNIFNALKLQNNEIRHSNFLGWLMTPYETHKIGDYFLKEFLKSALKNYSLEQKTEISLSDLIFYNLDDAEIRREYKNIDLLIISQKNNFICVIENKIWTGEHDCQLERYAEIVNTEFNGYKKLYIYLAPNNDDNCELLDRKFDKKPIYYIPMNYKQVFEVLEKTLRFKSSNVNSEVKTFIEHYKNMLERSIMGKKDENIVKLCRKIYRENRDAIDLIIESATCTQSDIDEILKNAISKKEDLILEISKNGWVRFVPKSADYDSLRCAKSDWVESDRILMIEINNATKNGICVDLIIRQADETPKAQDNHEKLIALASDLFNYKLKGKKDSYAHIVSKPIISASEYYNIVLNDNVEEYLTQAIYESGIIEDYIKLADKFNA